MDRVKTAADPEEPAAEGNAARQRARSLSERRRRQDRVDAQLRLPLRRTSPTPPARGRRRSSTATGSTRSARWATCSASNTARRQGRLVEELPEGLQGADSRVGLVGAPLARRRHAHRARRRRRSGGRGVRQEDRDGEVEGAHHEGNLLLAAGHHRGRRQAATHRVAVRSGLLARPRDRRRVLEARSTRTRAT